MRHYTGFSEYHAKRERQHQRGQGYWTSRADDWQEVFSTTVETRKEARSLEKKIKDRGAKRFMDSYCQGPAVGGMKFDPVTPEA